MGQTLLPTPLGAAVIDGNYEKVVYFLQRGDNPNAMYILHAGTGGVSGRHARETMLCRATMQSRYDIAGALLSYGARVDDSNEQQRTGLMVAAEKGDTYMVELILGFHPTINLSDSHGLSALALALLGSGSTTEKIQIVHKLLDRGADPSACTKSKETVLMLAAATGIHPILVRLLEFSEVRAQLRENNMHQRTAFDIFAMNGLKQRGWWDMLNALYFEGHNITRALEYASKTGDLPVVDYLLRLTGTALDAGVEGEMDVVDVATRHGHGHIVERLLMDPRVYASEDRKTARGLGPTDAVRNELSKESRKPLTPRMQTMPTDMAPDMQEEVEALLRCIAIDG